MIFGGNVDKPLADAIGLLDQAVELDPKFTLAYCALAKAHDLVYRTSDRTPERGALVEAAINNAMRLQPDLPEVHLAYAIHLYQVYRDYDRARSELAIARRGLPNDNEAAAVEAYMDRRQGRFEKAIQELNEASLRDPHDSVVIADLAITLIFVRQFRAANRRSIGGSNSVRISRYSKLKSQHLPFTLRPGMTPRSARRSLLSRHRRLRIEMPSICGWFSPWLIVIGS